MFVSYVIRYPGIIDITDSEFIDRIVVAPPAHHGLAEGLGYAVIKCYGDRNLPVAPNLVRAFQNHCTNDWSMEFVIWMNKENNPLYYKYAKQVERYLLLI
jgi:hypothetical protein